MNLVCKRQWEPEASGVWRNVEGVAVVPKPYIVADGSPVLADEKTLAMEEQIESKEVLIAGKYY